MRQAGLPTCIGEQLDAIRPRCGRRPSPFRRETCPRIPRLPELLFGRVVRTMRLGRDSNRKEHTRCTLPGAVHAVLYSARLFIARQHLAKFCYGFVGSRLLEDRLGLSILGVRRADTEDSFRKRKHLSRASGSAFACDQTDAQVPDVHSRRSPSLSADSGVARTDGQRQATERNEKGRIPRSLCHVQSVQDAMARTGQYSLDS